VGTEGGETAGRTVSLPSPRKRLRRAALRWCLSRQLVERMATRMRYKLLGADIGGFWARALWRLYVAFRSEFTAGELLATLQALESAGVECWLAGGWGVDALVGHQSRPHRDLDIVVDDFAEQAGRALSVLATLGFRPVRRFRYENWMPERWVLRDAELRLVDILGMDWERLRLVLGVGSKEELRRVAFTDGAVAGQRVPCLSAGVQLLYHTGYRARPEEADDVALLTSLAGGSTALALPSVPR